MDETILDALEDIQHILEDAGPDTKNFLEPILPYTPIFFASHDMSVENHENIALSPRVMNICREFQNYVESHEYEKAGILELKLRLWTLHLSVSACYAPPLELPLVREGDDEVQFTRMLNEMLQI